MSDLNVIGLVRNNSKDYIFEIFDAYNKNQIVVPLKSKDEIPKNNGLKFDRIIEPSSKWGWVKGQQKTIKNDSVAQISFTSGTEGEPKGIILTHENLSDVIERLNGIMGVDENIREYLGVPVYHSFGFGRVRACLSAGGQVYIPEKGFNLLEIIHLLQTDEINAISAVPTLCRLMLNEPKFLGSLGEKVRWVEIGSQYMSRHEKEQMKVLFPNAHIVQHYGLTEASRTTFLDITQTQGEALESVGKPTGSVEIAISNNSRIKVRGNHVANLRLSADGVMPLTDSEGWLLTNDKGFIENDYLFFQGRADDVINCGGLKIFPEIVEREIGKHIGCNNGFAVTKVKDLLRGDGILVAVESRLSSMIDEISEQTKVILKSLNVQAGNALHFEIVEHLPVTETGKIKRKLLTEKFEHKIEELKALKSPFPCVDIQIENDSVINIFRSVLTIDDIRPSDSFLSLGGDSIAFVTASLAVEEYIGWLPENWEAMTFENLEQLKAGGAIIDDENKYQHKTIYFLLFLLIFLIIGEGFLQVRSQLKHGRSAFNLVTNESAIIFNEELDVTTYRPNIVRNNRKTGKISLSINSLGLKSPEISSMPEKDELRIAVVGSSTVVYSSSIDDTISQLLENKLSQFYPGKVNVINGGIEGLTLAGIIKITKGIICPLKPSIIVVYTGLNNISAICRECSDDKQEVRNLPSIHLPDWLLTRELIRKNTSFLTAQKTKNTDVIDIDSIDTINYRNQLEDLVTYIINQGITPVLMTNARNYNNIPPDEQSKLIGDALFYYYCFDQDGLIAAGDTFNNHIRDVADDHDLMLIDLASVMPGGDKYFATGSHFSLEGRQFVASYIFELIKPLINSPNTE